MMSHLAHQYLTLGTHFGTVRLHTTFRKTGIVPIVPLFEPLFILYLKLFFKLKNFFHFRIFCYLFFWDIWDS